VTQKKRGRETALDMVRTLLVVFAVVLPLWFFGQASPDDSKKIRPVDPSEAYAAFAADAHGPTLVSVPAGWTCNVREYSESGVLRVGYVHDDSYLEVSGAKGTSFLEDATGKGKPVGTVDVAGTAWQSWENQAGAQSLVLTRDGVTVLVGGTRETSSQAELVAFAELLR
jgi:hypothetical protein